MLEEFDPELSETINCPKCSFSMPYAWFSDKSQMYVKFRQTPVEFGREFTNVQSHGRKYSITKKFMLRFCPGCQQVYKHKSTSYLPNGPGIPEPDGI